MIKAWKFDEFYVKDTTKVTKYGEWNVEKKFSNSFGIKPTLNQHWVKSMLSIEIKWRFSLIVIQRRRRFSNVKVHYMKDRKVTTMKSMKILSSRQKFSNFPLAAHKFSLIFSNFLIFLKIKSFYSKFSENSLLCL
jgi:hypothetical protein